MVSLSFSQPSLSRITPPLAEYYYSVLFILGSHTCQFRLPISVFVSFSDQESGKEAEPWQKEMELLRARMDELQAELCMETVLQTCLTAMKLNV